MSVKFSVGVSKAQQDRARLEQHRSSGEWVALGRPANAEERSPGWPLRGDEAADDETPETPPQWAW
jgi:hypothetical protein